MEISSKIKEKKAMFFTIIAILLVTSSILSFTLITHYTNYNKMKVVEIRAYTMNNFIHNIERDMERAIYISGFRALVSIDNYIITNGTFVSDVDAVFFEAMTNGTINGIEQPVMVNQTIIDWQNKIIKKAEDAGLIVNITIFNIDIEHNSPWEIKVSAMMNFSLTDSFNTAYWKRDNVVISNYIDITGFEDPVFSLNTGGLITRTIEKSNVTQWNVTTLKQHLSLGTYVNNTNAPSFLMRLENNLAPSPYGIESLVNTNELIIYGIQVKNETSVDYLYWGSGGINNTRIDGITNSGYPFFKLDNDHVTFYRVENNTY